MRLLIIHHEAEYFAGAEKMLGYFLEGLAAARCEFSLAAVRDSAFGRAIPSGISCCWLPANARFTFGQFRRQLQVIREHVRQHRVDLVHGWAARDWELTSAVGLTTRRPSLGTLHDHPKASFISRGRQRLMRACATVGLGRVVCVSEAVKSACADAGYPGRKLRVVRNGLPVFPADPRPQAPGPFRVGFLGQFSERKGLRGLLATMDKVAKASSAAWELELAGAPQGEDGQRLVQELQAHYAKSAWWPKAHWRGWVKEPRKFLQSIDLLICPSSEFDPFPTVLLEAGSVGVPVLGAHVGGVPEIVEDGVTGWLFHSQDWDGAARKLLQILESPAMAERAGQEAKKRVERQFAMARMVENYLKVYSELKGI